MLSLADSKPKFRDCGRCGHLTQQRESDRISNQAKGGEGAGTKADPRKGDRR